jgi:yecA family protein
MPAEGQAPLSAGERAALADRLAERAAQTGGMTLDAAQGFIAAALSGPEELPDRAWLRHVLGAVPGDGAAESLETLLRRFAAETREALALGTFAPLVPFRDIEAEEPLPLPYAWCAGYATALALHGDDILEEIDGADAPSDALARILSFLMYAPEDMHHPKDPAAHRAIAAGLGEAASTLYAWWCDRRAAGTGA